MDCESQWLSHILPHNLNSRVARKTREAWLPTAHSPNRTRGHAFFSRAFHLADFLGKVGLFLVWDVEDGIKIFEKNLSTVRNKILISPEKN